MRKYVLFCDDKKIYFSGIDNFSDFNAMVCTSNELNEAKKYNFKFQANKKLKEINNLSENNFRIRKIKKRFA